MVKLSTKSQFNFGKRLKELRKREGLTQQELGDKINVSARVILYYENETKYPPSHILIDLAKALNVTVEDLLGVKNMPKNPVDGKVWKKFKIVEKMTPSQQRQVFDFIKLVQKSAR